MGDLTTVVTVLLNATPDPQRGTTLPADPGLVADLAASLAEHDLRLTVLTDCLDDGDAGNVTFHRVAPGENPYFHRWAVVADHLEHAVLEGTEVWCVDATDVELLTRPDWVSRLHIGSEATLVGCPWMRKTNPSLGRWLDDNAGRTLLNPGVVGGPHGEVLDFARAIAARWPTDDLTDMGAANAVAYRHHPSHVTGHPVHTPYKADERTPGAWWKHK